MLPQFWFPTSANVSVTSSGSGFSVSLSWKRPPSPRPGCSVFINLISVFSCFSLSCTVLTYYLCCISKSYVVNSYPCILNSTGSPIGCILYNRDLCALYKSHIKKMLSECGLAPPTLRIVAV